MNINRLQAYKDEIKYLEKEIKTLTEDYKHNRRGSFTYSKEKKKRAVYAFFNLVLIFRDFLFYWPFSGWAY